MVDKFVGAFATFVGLACLLLLTALRVRGELAGDVKISAFLLCTGALLVWIGCTWLFSKCRSDETAHPAKYDRYLPVLLKVRPLVEFCAAVGLILVGARAIALLSGVDWMAPQELRVLISAPILIGLFALRILPPGAFQSGLFSENTVSRWSAPTRQVISLLIRVGWLGYPAIALASPSFRDFVPWTERTSVQFGASIFILLLYVSQILILHFGQTRSPQNASRV